METSGKGPTLTEDMTTLTTDSDVMFQNKGVHGELKSSFCAALSLSTLLFHSVGLSKYGLMPFIYLNKWSITTYMSSTV